MAANVTDNLDPQQEKALLALLSEPTVKKAADASGVPERTIYRWMDETEFGRAYRHARRKAFNQAISATQRYVPLAIQALTKITVDESAPHSARVSAAAAILKFSRDSIELDDMQERIASIEAQLNGGSGLSGTRRPVENRA